MKGFRHHSTYAEKVEEFELTCLASGNPDKADKQQQALSTQYAPAKDALELRGYRGVGWKTILYHLLCLCTCGALLVVAKWFVKLRLWLSLQRCELREATWVLTKAPGRRAELVPVQTVDIGPAVPRDQDADQDNPSARRVQEESQQLRVLEYHCKRYVFSAQSKAFVAVPPTRKDFAALLPHILTSLGAAGPETASLQWTGALAEHAASEAYFGANEIILPVASVAELLGEEMVHPFYMFQYASALLWIFEDYWVYAVVILLISLSSIAMSVGNAHHHRQRLAALAKHESQVKVLRHGTDRPRQLNDPRPRCEIRGTVCPVSNPGDVMVVGRGVLPCDLVLLQGNPIVDENMLTGEAVPVRKVAAAAGAPSRAFDPDAHKHCTLYGGTVVVQAGQQPGSEVVALVYRTRWASAKGQLLAGMLHPREGEAQFARDAIAFIAAMCALCTAMYLWSAAALMAAHAPPWMLALRFADLMTTAVPPGLPACLAVAIAIAISRLRAQQVYVTSPGKIAEAGHLDVICFDKTGTLTETGLEFQGVRVPAKGGFAGLERSSSALPAQVVQVLAACHGLAWLEGELIGDPLDQQLFAASGWRLSEAAPGGQHQSCAMVQPAGSDEEHRIVRRFEFSSETQRQVVVLQAPGGALWVGAKGSPEAICRLADPASLPPTFHRVLEELTQQGLRVLALAGRRLEPHGCGCGGEPAALTQQQAEQGMAFLGFAVLANPLRPCSAPAIAHLHAAALRTVMVTGDHARTAVSIARQCGILAPGKPAAYVDVAEGEAGQAKLQVLLVGRGYIAEEVSLGDLLQRLLVGDVECAVTGRGFQRLQALGEVQALGVLLQRANVWARMAPDDKRLLVNCLGPGPAEPCITGLQGLGHRVAFCGDGANDLGALKAAAVGVSLCEAEASVAAPLTAKLQSIGVMVAVIAEGRCSLNVSFIIFQYIVVYACIQIFSTNLMYSFALMMGSYQYLIQDLLYTTVLAALMGLSGPSRSLSVARPTARLMSAPVILPVALQIIIMTSFQALALFIVLRGTEDDAPPSPDRTFRFEPAPQNSVVFLVGVAQLLITTMIFNKGPPFRKALWTNQWLVVAMTTQLAFLLYLMLSPGDALTRNFAQLVVLPRICRLRLLAVISLNCLCSIAADGVSRLILRWHKGV